MFPRFEVQLLGRKMSCEFVRDFLFYCKLTSVLNHKVLIQEVGQPRVVEVEVGGI